MEIDKLISLAKHYLATNNLDYAEMYLKRALRIDLNNSIVNEHIGELYFLKNQLNEAIHYLKLACKANGCSHQAVYLLGSALLQIGEVKKAISYFELLITKAGKSFQVLHDLGTCYANCGDFNKAASLYEECLLFNKKSAHLYYNIGRINDELKNFTKAINYYKKAIELDSEFSFAYANIGTNLSYFKNYSEAIFFYKKAITINPKIEWVYGDMIYAEKMIGNYSHNFNEVDLIRIVTENGISPFALLSITDNAELQKLCSEQYCKNEQQAVFSNPKKLSRKNKIHVAFFSPDFCTHPVSYLTCDFFECLDKDIFEIYAFSLFDGNENDEMLLRQKNTFDFFINIETLSDYQISNLCREYKIDIAVDLAGYTQNSRPSIFRSKVAPIQINWLGYPGTLGSSSIDYIIADRFVIPDANKKFFTEDILYLPNTYLVDDRNRGLNLNSYRTSKFDHNLPENKIVLCAFHNAYKLNTPLLKIWVEIMKGASNSIIWLAENNSHFKKNVLSFFRMNDISEDRIVFSKRVDSIESHLYRLSLSDIYLDTFPYGAHSTALDAIKAGVPIVTLCGRSFASRVAGSLLNYLGMSDLICYSKEEYIELSLNLIKNPSELIKCKKRLKICLDNSQLFNTPLFTNQMESLLSEVYRNSTS